MVTSRSEIVISLDAIDHGWKLFPLRNVTQNLACDAPSLCSIQTSAPEILISCQHSASLTATQANEWVKHALSNFRIKLTDQTNCGHFINGDCRVLPVDIAKRPVTLQKRWRARNYTGNGSVSVQLANISSGGESKHTKIREQGDHPPR